MGWFFYTCLTLLMICGFLLGWICRIRFKEKRTEVKVRKEGAAVAFGLIHR